MSAAKVAPFRALRFQLARVGDLGGVLAPPYDVITPESAAELRRRDPHNIARVTNPEGEGPERYREAARTLGSWISAGSLARDSQPAFYVHLHRFTRSGNVLVRTGFWGLIRLTPFEAGIVLPHERTMSEPRADRLALMRACRAQLSPVFLICSDPGGGIGRRLSELARGVPMEQAEFPAGEYHEMWRVVDGEEIEALTAALEDQIFLIADGHHRYETALAYREGLITGGTPQTGRNAHDYVLAYVVPEGDPGLLLLPTHRVVAGGTLDWNGALERVSHRFQVRRLDVAELETAARRLEGEVGRPTFVLAVRGEPGGWQLSLRQAQLPSAIAAQAFQAVLLGEGLALTGAQQVALLSYVHEAAEALDRVRSGRAEAAALLAAPRVGQVREVALAGGRLPSKTTYFWPKVPTGIAIHLIEPGEEIVAANRP